MKKYVSLFIVLAMMLVVGVKTIGAEENKTVPTLINENVPIERILDKKIRPALIKEKEEKMQREERIKNQIKKE